MAHDSELELSDEKVVPSINQEKHSFFQRHLDNHPRMAQYNSQLQRFLKWIEVPTKEGEINTFLNNEDLKPVEVARQTWGWKNFVSFWIADSFNINTWEIAATGIQLGLTWWQVWLCVWIGYFFCGVFVVLSGRIGAIYHVSFPVAGRSTFGIFGSIWPVINRVVMACVWYGVQGWLGGQCIQVCLLAIWPSARHMKNGIPGSGTTTFEFLSYFLFWLFSLPFIYIRPHNLRHLFMVKAAIVPVAGISFLVWTCVKAHGIGPIMKQPATVHGSVMGWAFMTAIMNSLSNFATIIVNAPDFTRFAKEPNAIVLSQLIAVPTAFSLTSFIGIIVSSSATVLYDENIWNPLDVLHKFLEGNKSGSRAGVFFLGFAFAVAQLGTNIAANSLSAGTDMTALLPKYINIRRGGFICAGIALCICPWHLLSSSSNFTTYLSAYATFLSAIAGCSFSDYYLVRKGYIYVGDLYNASKGSTYMYRYGVNWRAFAAYFCGIAINVVGFADAVSDGGVNETARKMYQLNFFLGFLVSAISYYGFNWLSPVVGARETWSEDPNASAMYDEITTDELSQDSQSYDPEEWDRKIANDDPVKTTAIIS
ncbi:permease [Yarrowia lipolytica]|jgi:NCS1 family nucleobase:cation symporter-1|uniref:YALI0D05621p n=2 Tax=Yarrowia lipolytica TaxID=4952 RepID=Q6CA61_YARLI|nr:YALI0D05621p [Yarrowia lipolytica CLIB122]AOW03628.1 hypothetical protein YALI1_D07232g [Yarrowia lipolytica]KAE8170485.1 permease for cytosine/purines, uracil, thiamine, allantoin-domain-containing protein [Yarrowia lipolytica]KAJ8054755.1 permease for cytosine/purines, uracil, thiamine, allantoin-domain-containing protein [Yarrowia lipolytica]QNP98571.1 Uracil permease [Yarrowia lipolytica]RDW29847.1 permease [Yarrowia lipolytica]|eukprot:XP_502451.1 YALI0D05621p [Yarrowia lipolytica CLIB122]